MRRYVAMITGVCASLLILRLVARLLAARPDNAVFHALFTATSPLVLPFQLSGFDQYQPRFGAVLELSTLLMALVVLTAGTITWLLLPPPGHRQK